MKLAVIGAGSTYTPELVSGLIRERERVDVHELVLHDIDPERSEVVGGLAQRILERQGYSGRADHHGRARSGARRRRRGPDPDPGRRPGGALARRDDPSRVRLRRPGDDRRRRARRRRCGRCRWCSRSRSGRASSPATDAWIVDFTNPVGIVTRALLDAGHRAIGLCNVAINFQRQIAAHLGVPPERVLVDQVGLNHLTWIRAVWVDGRDVLDEVIGGFRRRARARDRPAASADRGAGRDSVLLPALLLRRARGGPGAADDHSARSSGRSRSNAACSTSTAIRR